MSGAARRRTGASRSLERLVGHGGGDLRAEAGGAGVLVQHQDPRGAAHGLEHGLAVPGQDRPQVEHLDLEAVLGRQPVGGVLGGVHHRAPGDDRRVVARAVHPRAAELDGLAALGHLALEPAVQVLVLEVEHRVRIVQRRQQQALGVGRRGRARDLQTRHVREAGLGVLRVEGAAGEAAAARQPHHDGDADAGSVMLLGRHGHDVVPGAGHEVGELHLRDGAHAGDRGARAGADDGGLGQRRVDHARGAELLLEPVRGLEGAAGRADVLPDDEDALVPAQLVAERLPDRLDVGPFGHDGRLREVD